jgi:hypothetical protein
MAVNVFRSTTVIAALFILAFAAAESNAQCCGVATTAFYQPATHTAYSPVVVQTNPGWYPGYFLDRMRTRLWGAPTAYVASYPTTYVASYPSTYVASYPSYTTSYAASYAPVSTCSTCAPSQQVTMRPVVACDPCVSCSPCSSCGVVQTSYEQSSGCASCGVESYSESVGTSTPTNGTGQPSIPPAEPTPTQRSLKVDPDDTETPPAEEPNETTPDETTTEDASEQNAEYFKAPELFAPKNDRTAQRKISPVRTALYQQSIGYRSVSNLPQRITAEQAKRDAMGWTSASN